MTSTLKCRTLLRYIGLICQHIIELRLLGFKLVWLAARIWNQYNSHFTSKLDQLHKALYQDIETRFSHYCNVPYYYNVIWQPIWPIFIMCPNFPLNIYIFLHVILQLSKGYTLFCTYFTLYQSLFFIHHLILFIRYII